MIILLHRKIIGALLFLIAVLGSSVGAPPRSSYYPFESESDYRGKVHVLRGLMRRYGRTRVNRIYVVKADSGNGSIFLYGYWPEGHSIWLVGNLDPWFENGRELTDYGWLEYKMRTNLRTDVVPTEADIGGSSYLVDRPWTRRIIKACLTRGRKLVIYRTTRR